MDDVRDLVLLDLRQFIEAAKSLAARALRRLGLYDFNVLTKAHQLVRERVEDDVQGLLVRELTIHLRALQLNFHTLAHSQARQVFLDLFHHTLFVSELSSLVFNVRHFLYLFCP